MPEGWLARFRKKGFPCPRPAREMDYETAVAWEVLNLSLGDFTRHFAEPTLSEHIPDEDERTRLRRRVTRALCDPEVQSILFPKRADEEDTAKNAQPSQNEEGP